MKTLLEQQNAIIEHGDHPALEEHLRLLSDWQVERLVLRLLSTTQTSLTVMVLTELSKRRSK